MIWPDAQGTEQKLYLNYNFGGVAMSIKLNISYTYEYELEQILKLLKPILETGCGYKILDGAKYSHCYIPKKGDLTLKMLKNQ